MLWFVVLSVRNWYTLLCLVQTVHSRTGPSHPLGPRYSSSSRAIVTDPFAWFLLFIMACQGCGEGVAGTPPILRTGLPLCRSPRKLLAELFHSFPRHHGCLHMWPLDQHLLHGAITDSPTTLQEMDRHLKLDQFRGQRSTCYLRTWQMLQQWDLKH
jgi:hypothetical protein